MYYLLYHIGLPLLQVTKNLNCCGLKIRVYISHNEKSRDGQLLTLFLQHLYLLSQMGLIMHITSLSQDNFSTYHILSRMKGAKGHFIGLCLFS